MTKKSVIARQVGDDVLGHAFRKILLFGIAAHIGKRQHGDRGFLRLRARRSARRHDQADRLAGRHLESNAMGAHRSSDVLDLPFAHVLERELELVTHLVPHGAADADAARLRQRFKPRRYVDAVSVDVLVVDDDVADVQADTKLDAAIRWNLDVALGYLSLHLDGTADRIDDAGKLDKKAVACRLDDTATVFGDLWIHDRTHVALERCQCAFLVEAHQPRISRDISRENRREAPLDPLFRQIDLLKGGTRPVRPVRIRKRLDAVVVNFGAPRHRWRHQFSIILSEALRQNGLANAKKIGNPLRLLRFPAILWRAGFGPTKLEIKLCGALRSRGLAAG